jgi:hypothetical protein
MTGASAGHGDVSGAMNRASADHAEVVGASGPSRS